MHRSGTSWLAGTLQQLGVELGEVNERAPYNAHGNRENERIQILHDAVLGESGGSWRRPPRRVVWSATRLAELRAIVRAMDDQFERWGFKDPRTLLALDGWKEVLGDRLSPVG